MLYKNTGYGNYGNPENPNPEKMPKRIRYSKEKQKQQK